jgi:hypothetical protein
MDSKSISHLYKESRSLDIVRALIWGDRTVQTTVRAKVQREQRWTRKSAIFVCAAKIAETILSFTEPAIGNVALVEPPLVIHDTQPQDLQPPQSPLHELSGDLDLPLHPHLIVEPGPQPLQAEPIPTQADTVPKVSAIRCEVREFFKRRKMRHGLLASAGILCRETFLLYCRLRMNASRGSLTCGTFHVVSWNLLWIAAMTCFSPSEGEGSVNWSIANSVGTWRNRRSSMFTFIVKLRLTWRHNSVLNHIAGCLKTALVGKSTVELYCDLDGLQALGGESMVQAQRQDIVILDWSMHGRHRITLVELTCLWDTDAKRAKEWKTSKLLSAMRGGIVVCIWSRLEGEAIFSGRLRTVFGHYFRLGSLQATDERCQ